VEPPIRGTALVDLVHSRFQQWLPYRLRLPPSPVDSGWKSFWQLRIVQKHNLATPIELVGQPKELICVVFGVCQAHGRYSLSQGKDSCVIAPCYHDPALLYLLDHL
jgi:hypothetical protein